MEPLHGLVNSVSLVIRDLHDVVNFVKLVICGLVTTLTSSRNHLLCLQRCLLALAVGYDHSARAAFRASTDSVVSRLLVEGLQQCHRRQTYNTHVSHTVFGAWQRPAAKKNREQTVHAQPAIKSASQVPSVLYPHNIDQLQILWDRATRLGTGCDQNALPGDVVSVPVLLEGLSKAIVAVRQGIT